MVSREEMLGERDLKDVGVDGIEPDEVAYEELAGYDSLYWLPASEGVDVQVLRVFLGVVKVEEVI